MRKPHMTIDFVRREHAYAVVCSMCGVSERVPESLESARREGREHLAWHRQTRKDTGGPPWPPFVSPRAPGVLGIATNEALCQ